MNNKLWMPLIAAAGIALMSASANVAAAGKDGYWIQPPDNNRVWRNTPGECWRTGYWTPAMANKECDPKLVPAAPKPKPAAAAPAPAPKAAPAEKPKPRPVAKKVTFEADVLFDFDKSVIKPAGKSKLDALVGQVKNVNLEVVIAIGHTDSIGSDAYNQKLSVRRANAVKAYLVSKGVPANRVYTEGKGEKQPVASNRTRDGRAKNRRVDVEVIGTAK